MKLITKISRLLAYFYVLLRFLFKRSRIVENGCVLLIQWGGIGDAVLDAKSILSLNEYYLKRGKRVSVAVRNNVKNALEKILDIHTLDFIVLENDCLKVSSIKKTLSDLNETGYESIVSLSPWYNWPSLYIAACLPSNESWGVFPEHYSRIFKRILFKSYTNRIMVSIDVPRVQRNKLLMKVLGISDHKTEITAIPSRGRGDRPNNSIVLSVDSSNPVRGWAQENFIALAGKLLKRYPYDIYLTGANVEPDAVDRYERSFAGNDRVKIMTGKLSIDEWVETIRGSRFVVSLDSGAVHVAASTGTTCFCLTGVWDGHRYMPYRVDKLNPGTKEPICVYRTDVNVEELACYDCVGKRRYGWGNKECADQCKKGQPCLCLSKITVDDVMTAIEKAKCDGVIC